MRLQARITRLEIAQQPSTLPTIIVVYEPADNLAAQERGTRHAEAVMDALRTQRRARGLATPILTATVGADGHVCIHLLPILDGATLPRWCGAVHGMVC